MINILSETICICWCTFNSANYTCF